MIQFPCAHALHGTTDDDVACTYDCDAASIKAMEAITECVEGSKVANNTLSISH